MAIYGPSTCTELNEIGGSLGGAGVFNAASFCTLGDAVALGAVSIGWTGLARRGAGAVWAASATVKLNVAAQHNSKRDLAMENENQAVVSSRDVRFRNLLEGVAVHGRKVRDREGTIASTRGACALRKLTIALPLPRHCAAVNP